MLPLYIYVLTGEYYDSPLLETVAMLICAGHPHILRSVNPCPIAVHMEPLPPRPSWFVIEYLLLPPRSATYLTQHSLLHCD